MVLELQHLIVGRTGIDFGLPRELQLLQSILGTLRQGVQPRSLRLGNLRRGRRRVRAGGERGVWIRELL